MNKKSFLLSLALCSAILLPGCGAKNDSPDAQALNLLNNDEYCPVSSIAMTEEEAASLNNSLKVKLYYKTAKGDKLSYETKLIQFTDKDKKNDILAAKIVETLIKGPSSSSLVKTLPEGTALNNIKITKNTIFVDFNEAFGAAISDSENAKFIAFSIANTLTEFKNIDEVVITCCQNKISASSCDFSNLHRNIEIVTDIESAMRETDYSENVFLEIELE